MRWTWYWNRLRAMSLQEIVYRIEQESKKTLQQFGLLRADSPPGPVGSAPGFIGEPPARATFNPQRYTSKAEEILSGRLTVFEVEVETDESTPNWHMDPKTGRIAPSRFANRINYRDSSLVGDIKYLWELNRHLHITNLAQAYFLSQDARYLEAIGRHIRSWMVQNPYLIGANWTSSLELAIRLINWSVVWRLVGGDDSELFSGEKGAQFRVEWLECIYRHLHFIGQRPSKYSSANNHLIGEAVGLLVGATSWPLWQETQEWYDTGCRTLIRECLVQISEQGVDKEQSIGYQVFVAEFLLISYLVSSSRTDEMAGRLSSKLSLVLPRMSAFLEAVSHSQDSLPDFGDNDDGEVLKLVPSTEGAKHRQLIDVIGTLFEGQRPYRMSEPSSELGQWLGVASRKQDLGDSRGFEETRRANMKRQGLRLDAFNDAGYYVLLRSGEDTPEIQLVFDAGPLGYGPMAAHGHADALSFTLAVGGVPILIDTGTFTYFGDQSWRDYFRSTRSHNTVMVDGENQSVMTGPFIWSHKATGRLEKADEDGQRLVVAGMHDGYRRLRKPVVHRRRIELTQGSPEVLFNDSFETSGDHSLEWNFHFGTDCRVRLIHESLFRVSLVGRLEVELKIGWSPKRVALIRGPDGPPIGGWCSPRFGERAECSTLRLLSEISGPSSFTGTFRLIGRD